MKWPPDGLRVTIYYLWMLISFWGPNNTADVFEVKIASKQPQYLRLKFGWAWANFDLVYMEAAYSVGNKATSNFLFS